MTGFEPRTPGVWRDCSTNWATTTVLNVCYHFSCSVCLFSLSVHLSHPLLLEKPWTWSCSCCSCLSICSSRSSATKSRQTDFERKKERKKERSESWREWKRFYFYFFTGHWQAPMSEWICLQLPTCCPRLESWTHHRADWSKLGHFKK